MFLFALQCEAAGGDVQGLIAELEEDQAGKPEKPRGHGRKRLPRTLTRERIEYELSEAERACPHCAATRATDRRRGERAVGICAGVAEGDAKRRAGSTPARGAAL